MTKKDLNKATDLVAENKFEEAKELLSTFNTEEEKNIEVIKLLGLCNINLEKYEEAKNNFETVVKYNPEDATSWMYLAMSYDNLEDNLHAISAYKEVIKLREKETEAI